MKTNPGPPGLGLDIGLATQFRKKTYSAMESQSSIAGWIFGKRTMERKRMKTTEFNIVTWNVRPRQWWEQDVMEDLRKAESKKLEGDS